MEELINQKKRELNQLKEEIEKYDEILKDPYTNHSACSKALSKLVIKHNQIANWLNSVKLQQL